MEPGPAQLLLGRPLPGGKADASGAGVLAGLSRAELFAALCVLGFANGIAGGVHRSILKDGMAAAFADTFGISVIVWAAFLTCAALLLRAPRAPLTAWDRVVAASVIAAFLVPSSSAAWVALTGLALYMLRDSFPLRQRPPLSATHRAAWILLATTGAMHWGHWLLVLASDLILGADAVLVGWLAGTETVGNTVRFADGSGYVWIEPACSSLANVSLAILTWVLVVQIRGIGWSLKSARWCLLACLSVIAINVARIAFIVMYREHYNLVHGPTGAAVASWLTMGATLGICVYGARRHGRVAHA